MDRPSDRPGILNPQTDAILRRQVWKVTAAVLVLVGIMMNPKVKLNLPAGVSLDFLPAVHAVLNTLVALSLIGAIIAVKRGNISLHRLLITTAMVLSGLFLVGYVSYHLTNDPVLYQGTGPIRNVYFFLLITHIVLAAVSFPFILLAYLAGWADRREAHRRLVRFVFPMWLYVAVTGPIVYLMLY
jgi:putative membrane protein